VPHGERRAQGGHHVGDARLVQRNDVGVAFHYDGAAGRRDRETVRRDPV